MVILSKCLVLGRLIEAPSNHEFTPLFLFSSQFVKASETLGLSLKNLLQFYVF
jgi:hypothetical protein